MSLFMFYLNISPATLQCTLQSVLLLRRHLLLRGRLVALGQLGRPQRVLPEGARHDRLGRQLHSATLGDLGRAHHLALLRGQDGTPLHDLRVRVQLDEGARVGQRVEATHVAGHVLLGATQHAGDLLGLEQALEVGVGHLGVGHRVALLGQRLLLPGAEDVVQALEGGLRPDDEAADVTTGGQLQQAHLVDVHRLHAGNVAEGLLQAIVLRVDDQRSTALDAAAVAHLTTASTEALRLVHLERGWDTKSWVVINQSVRW